MQAKYTDKKHRIVNVTLYPLTLAPRAPHKVHSSRGSAAARALEFGIDLTLTIENLRLTPEERIRKLDCFIESVRELKASIRLIDPANAIAEQHH